MTDPQPPFPFTRESTIRIDPQGAFWHDGQRVQHPGLAEAFARWLDVDHDTGRYIVRNSINWVYVTVDDAPLVVRGVADEGGQLVISVSDGTREPLRADTLRVDDDDVPYCDVRDGRLPARFTPQAAFALFERLGSGVSSLRRVARGEGGKRR
jgi:hypothetical protein